MASRLNAPSHYLNQCWNMVNSNIRNKLQWNLKRISLKMHLKMSSGKWRPFCLGLNVLMRTLCHVILVVIINHHHYHHHRQRYHCYHYNHHYHYYYYHYRHCRGRTSSSTVVVNFLLSSLLFEMFNFFKFSWHPCFVEGCHNVRNLAPNWYWLHTIGTAIYSF